MRFHYTDQPYASNRYPIVAKNGMVATGSPLASAAGLAILRKGGNAIDAAIATAATLTVVEPTANGIGSDAFAIVWHKGQLHGLNASGISAQNISIERVRGKEGNITKMPAHGWTPVMVPGVPKAWASLCRKFGKLSLAECLEPAIRYAEEGYPIAPHLAEMWSHAVHQFTKLYKDKPAFASWFETFTVNGDAPLAGEMMTLPKHAAALKDIGRTEAKSFYEGALCDAMLAHSAAYGGFFVKEDFKSYDVQYVDVLKLPYHGYSICEIPPNGQGIVALMALNTLQSFSFSQRDHIDTLHTQIEAMKMAFADGMHYITDPLAMHIDPQQLLCEAYGKTRAASITSHAQVPSVYELPGSNTVYLCTADNEGNMVSYIQSNYMGFGSGIVVDGISLQNRGHDFSLDPAHTNALAPSKKTYHTIIPGFIMQGDRPIGPFGVMGGYMQPQGHVQVAMNLIDFHLNPQMALDAPRWQWVSGKKILVERSFPAHLVQQLTERGHEVEIPLRSTIFGRGQMILRLENGVLVGGCESRTDSNIACF